MGEKRVIEQIASDEIYNDDWFLKDSALEGTSKVQPSVMKTYFNQGMATSQDLADEATARENADTALGGRIDDEATARQQADTALGQRIDNLNFSADAISYDNTSSGLEADNVQDAIGETITKLSAVGSASGDIATFTDGSDLPMPTLKIGIEPQQDLHGYDSPWVGGAGKNKCNPNINEWNNLTYKYIKLPNFNDDNYIMSFVDKDTSVDLTGINFGFMHNYPDESTQFRWVIINGEIQSDKTNVSQVDRTTKCDTLIIYPNTQSAFESIFARYNVQVEKGTTATSFAPYSNICPIIGWDECNVTRCGKNLFDKDSIRRGVYTKQDGTTLSSSATTNFSSQFIKVKPNTIYSITMFEESYENGSLYGIYYDEYKNGINQSTNIQNLISNNSKTFTTPSNAHYIVFSGYNGAGTDIFTTANTMVCEGTPITYEPYNGQTYTIDLDGTRYGGKVDLVSGVMTVDRGILTLNGSEDYYTIQSSSADGNTVLRVATSQPCKQNENQKSNYGTFDNYAWQSLESRANTFVLGSEGNLYLQLPSNTASTVEEFKALFASNNLQVVYELATPLTIQLSPTVVKSLRGMNNVFADCGAILDAEYIRDLTAIINYILEQLGN